MIDVDHQDEVDGSVRQARIDDAADTTPLTAGLRTLNALAKQLRQRSPLQWFERGKLAMIAGFRGLTPGLRQAGVKKGDRVAVMGLGGLGHMAVKFAAAMGADVTVLSRTDAKAGG